MATTLSTTRYDPRGHEATGIQPPLSLLAWTPRGYPAGGDSRTVVVDRSGEVLQLGGVAPTTGRNGTRMVGSSYDWDKLGQALNQ